MHTLLQYKEHTLGVRCEGRGLGVLGNFTDHSSAGSYAELEHILPTITTQSSALDSLLPFIDVMNSS